MSNETRHEQPVMTTGFVPEDVTVQEELMPSISAAVYVNPVKAFPDAPLVVNGVPDEGSYSPTAEQENDLVVIACFVNVVVVEQFSV